VRVCIHRGAAEIGGSCVEVEHDDPRVLIDLGRPLETLLDENIPLPQVAGLDCADPSLLGLIVSHSHPDHWGLVPAAHPGIPLYLGEATARILGEAAFFSPTGGHLKPHEHLEDRRPLAIGPFRVTPYLVDHSGFDAYSLLVEAGDKRLFYSGDLRAHGRKARLFEELIRDPPANIHALLLEGTTISRSNSGLRASEADVEERCLELIRTTDGLVLAFYSGQNIDRLISLYRATRRAGRIVVMDLYTATIARATGRPKTIPQADWGGVRVFVPFSQRLKVKRSGEFKRINWIHDRRVFPEELAGRTADLVMTFRGSMSRDLERADALAGARAIWSMWAGYLIEPSGEQVRDWLDGHRIPLEIVHSSGHAAVSDLQRLAKAVNAVQVVPIHTDHPQRYAELFDRVQIHQDGVWWSV
jgi:ribonuclease J